MPDDVWAVVVARVGEGTKSRLANTLSKRQRHQLALAMLIDVLDACRAADSLLAGTLAVVDQPEARAAAARSGAIPLADPGAGDMNAAVRVGLAAAARR